MKKELWQLFLDTGAPEAYLMFKKLEAEERNVSDNQRTGAAGHGLQ